MAMDDGSSSPTVYGFPRPALDVVALTTDHKKHGSFLAMDESRRVLLKLIEF